MEYSINRLSKLAGVSTRTLRYYDDVGLLNPKRISSNKYRIYGQEEIDMLQQILYYRELDVPLNEIKKIIGSESFDGMSALEGHLSVLMEKRERLNLLIANVEKTIAATKGEIDMSNEEKFEGFKKKMIDENEMKYGEEIREKYGESSVAASYKKVKDMTQEQYAEIEKLSQKLNETLKAAFEQGDPESELAVQACGLHKEWLCYFWDSYSKEAHKGLAQTYVDDPRFTAYYDKIAVGCAEFLRDAIFSYCK